MTDPVTPTPPGADDSTRPPCQPQTEPVTETGASS